MIDRKILDRKMKTGISGMSTGLMRMRYRLFLIFLSKIFLSSMSPVPQTPDFTTIRL